MSPGAPRPKRAAATNARDLLSGKREREGFFDAEDDARAKAAADAPPRRRAPRGEELIARWQGEDRLKQQQRLEESEKIRLHGRARRPNANVVALTPRKDGMTAMIRTTPR